MKVVFHFQKKMWVVFHISSSWVETILQTENQLPRLPRAKCRSPSNWKILRLSSIFKKNEVLLQAPAHLSWADRNNSELVAGNQLNLLFTFVGLLLNSWYQFIKFWNMEDDINQRRPQSKTTPMEDNLSVIFDSTSYD